MIHLSGEIKEQHLHSLAGGQLRSKSLSVCATRHRGGAWGGRTTGIICQEDTGQKEAVGGWGRVTSCPCCLCAPWGASQGFGPRPMPLVQESERS